MLLAKGEIFGRDIIFYFAALSIYLTIGLTAVYTMFLLAISRIALAVLLALGPLFRALPPWGVGWLMAGGLFYTSGVAFYVMDKRFPYFHGIWHLFVLAGSLCHYFAVLFYI